MRTNRRWAEWLAALSSILLLVTGAAYAQTDADTVDPDTLIEAVSTDRTDGEVAERLRSIYAQIGSLEDVTVEVREGVVLLAGSVSNDAQATRALELATRMESVVTVDDQIERRLDLEGNVLPLVDRLQADISRWLRALPLIMVALTVLALIVLAGQLLGRWKWLWHNIAPNPFLAELLAQAVRVIAAIIGLVVAFNILGATALIGTILGGAGVIGIAIGFAVRDTMENYVSSIMLSVRQPFRANDHVVIGDQEGKVIRLTSRATILMTLDGNHLRIPNSTVFKAVILNYTRNPDRRFDFTLGVDAADDPVAAMATGIEALTELDFILQKPAAGALIQDVGDSSIGIRFMAWVDQNQSDFAKARSLAIRAVKDVLEDNSFTLPEPIYRLRFDNVAGAATLADEDRVEAGKPAPAAERKPAAPIADDSIMDVKPDVELERMVNDERASGDTDDNLLDENRPVE